MRKDSEHQRHDASAGSESAIAVPGRKQWQTPHVINGTLSEAETGGAAHSDGVNNS